MKETKRSKRVCLFKSGGKQVEESLKQVPGKKSESTT